MASAMLDLVIHADARPTLPTAHLEGRITLTYGGMAELIGEFEQALRYDGKALVLCAGDREIYTDTALLLAGALRELLG
jgi:hypothetical protein